jgi:hypothetical protein
MQDAICINGAVTIKLQRRFAQPCPISQQTVLSKKEQGGRERRNGEIKIFLLLHRAF